MGFPRYIVLKFYCFKMSLFDTSSNGVTEYLVFKEILPSISCVLKNAIIYAIDSTFANHCYL